MSLAPEEELIRLYTPAMLAQVLDVPVSQVRNWQRRGWLVPAAESHRLARFDFAQLKVARQLADLLRSGVGSRRVQQQLSELQQRAPHIERPLAELSWTIEGHQVLVRHEQGWIETGGQLRLDFEALEASDELAVAPVPPTVFLTRDTAAPQNSVEQLTQWAAELDESGQLTAAAEMYRAALAAGGPRAELCFQLAETLYRLGELAAARERYFMALELDDDYVEARVNLGCVLAELNQPELAVAALLGAIADDRTCADAHYHCARLLDELGRIDEARQHWQSFAMLAPESPWADEAHHRLQP